MKRLAVLVLIPILLLPACSQPTPEVIKETVVVYVTQQPLPTYTPYPTYTSVPAALTHTPYPTPTPRAATPTSTPTPYPTPTPRATTPTSTPTPVAVPTATPVPTLTVEELAQSLHTPWAAKDWEEVIRLIEQILAINPDYGDMTEKLYAAHVNYARQLAAKGKLEEAKEEFTSALAIKPDGGEAIAELQALGSETPTSQAATPTSEPMPEGKIAFVSEGEFDHFEPYPWEIYVMNADGTGVVRLTENPFFEDEPSWSPDGNRIAFVSGGVGYINIYVMNADGTGRVGLTDGFHNACPTWSPDGRRIAFEIFRDRPGEMNGEIYVMNADGTEQVNLTKNPAEDRSPSWSPDGNRIAFVSDRDGNLEIYVMNADGMGVVRLTDNPSGEHNPMWSPDGNRIAFVSDRDGNLEINVMDADGTGQINLTKNPAEDHYPSWSPDGRQIAFDSNRDGNFEIYVMNTDGSGSVNLTTTPVNDRMPAWASVPIPKPISSPAVPLISPWPMYRHDAQRTACTTYKGPEVPQLKWTFEAGGSLSSPVIGADGTIYVDSEDGHLYAIDPSGGKKWAYAIAGERTSQSVIAAGETIYVARASNLYAIRPDGTLKWAYSSDGEVYDLAIAPDGTIYIAGECLHALSPDGKGKWVTGSEMCTGFGAVAIAEDGTVYGMTGLDVCAFSSDGVLKWEDWTAPGVRGLNTAITLDPYEWVYVNGEAGLGAIMALPIASFCCLTPDGYRLEDFPGYIASPPAIGQDGTVYVGWREIGEEFETEDGRITAELGPLHLHAAAFPSGLFGLTKWTYSLGSAMCGYPVIGGDGTVYVILCTGDLCAFESSGNPKWTFNIGESLEVGHWSAWGLAIGTGTLYVSSGSKLYAIGESG